MTKQAALRSLARRQYLTKAAGLLTDMVVAPHYSIGRRLRDSADISNAQGKHGTLGYVSEGTGTLTGMLIGSGLGGAIGGAIGGRKGADRGSLIGTATPTILAAIAALVRRRRTVQEQVDNDTGARILLKHIVPGLAQYDAYKRIGSTRNYDKVYEDRTKDFLKQLSHVEQTRQSAEDKAPERPESKEK